MNAGLGDNSDIEEVGDAQELLWGDANGPGARCVLFDFDGPVCRLFPEGSSRALADRLRDLVSAFGLAGVLTPQERTDKNPHAVLRALHRARWDEDLGDADVEGLVDRLEVCVTEGELAAARTAWPTPHAHALIRRLVAGGLRLAVVTNNSPKAAGHYLRAHGLHGCFEAIHGRTADPDLMKPHPDVLHRALGSLGLPAEDAVMIGDAPMDFLAAERAGVRFIGYGRNALKRARMRDAGAKVVVGSFAPLFPETGRSGVGEAAGGARVR
ncbi:MULTISPECIES: HAD family hydrolase [unclassified Streptomyces]|uniref:HAD family hydrolase n=1 Tax=unclassified Streptomyces TaxID=2593676 RepID=UPI0033317AD8